MDLGLLGFRGYGVRGFMCLIKPYTEVLPTPSVPWESSI